MSNKIVTYLMYALGEIILVVVGILVAVSIDDWNREQDLVRDELEAYQLIIADLKKDSLLMRDYHGFYTKYLDTYFALNAQIDEGVITETVSYDHVVSNIAFNTVTHQNHARSIELMRNQEVREAINSYFQIMTTCNHAKDEFNKIIEKETRPFFLIEKTAFDYEVVFNNEDRTFPPFLQVSTVDASKMTTALKDPKAQSLIALLRMSAGYYVASLDRAMQRNAALIKILESKVES